MVEVIEKNGKKRFKCEECGFLYSSRHWAEKCETYCKDNKSCSLEITKHAEH